MSPRYRLSVLVLLVALTACAPDLRPAEIDGPAGPICDFERSVISMRILNDGTDAPESVTAVTFPHGAKAVRVATPAVGTKSGTTVTVPIPKPIPSPGDVRFDIDVDVDNAVAESNEGNNSVRGGDCSPGIEP